MWKIYYTSVKYGVLLQNSSLTEIVAKWFLAIETLVEDNSDTPYIYLTRYLRRQLANNKALWRQVPVELMHSSTCKEQSLTCA